MLCRYGEFKGVGGFADSATGEAVRRDKANICCGAYGGGFSEEFGVGEGLCALNERIYFRFLLDFLF